MSQRALSKCVLCLEKTGWIVRWGEVSVTFYLRANLTDDVRWRIIDAPIERWPVVGEELDTQGEAAPSARVRLPLTQHLGAARLGPENAKHHAWSGR